jgi:hypothetical protein
MINGTLPWKKEGFFIERDLGAGNAAHIDLLSDRKIRKQLRGMGIGDDISKDAICILFIVRNRFRYIDLLHESRHTIQIIRAGKQGVMLNKYNAPLIRCF